MSGVKFQTLRSTLIAYPDTLLGTMFAERNRELTNCIDNKYFIDRYGTLFSYILEYYRSDKLILSDIKTDISNENILARIQEEMNYFQILYNTELQFSLVQREKNFCRDS